MSNESKIRILYVQPGKYPERRVIEHTLAATQTLVGGDIEARVPLPDSLIQEFVEVVTPIKDNLYHWKLNFGPQVPHAERTDLTKIEQDPLLKFRINFETARQYRQKNGMPSQFRRCSWTDLRVEVYV